MGRRKKTRSKAKHQENEAEPYSEDEQQHLDLGVLTRARRRQLTNRFQLLDHVPQSPQTPTAKIPGIQDQLQQQPHQQNHSAQYTSRRDLLIGIPTQPDILIQQRGSLVQPLQSYSYNGQSPRLELHLSPQFNGQLQNSLSIQQPQQQIYSTTMASPLEQWQMEQAAFRTHNYDYQRLNIPLFQHRQLQQRATPDNWLAQQYQDQQRVTLDNLLTQQRVVANDLLAQPQFLFKSKC